MPEDEATELAVDPDVGRVAAELFPDAHRRLVVWTAPMGSGKSIASERYHQDALEAAATRDDAPLPVFLRGGLRSQPMPPAFGSAVASSAKQQCRVRAHRRAAALT